MTMKFVDRGRKDDEWIFECIVDFDPDSGEEAQANADIREVAEWCSRSSSSEDAYVVFERVSRFEMFSHSPTELIELENERSVRVKVAFKSDDDAVLFKLTWGREL
jgi:hypothetical protein